jgi:RAS protein activator-like 2
VFEVKGLSDRKKYFCEIHVDDKIYARTSSKKMLGMCFWGEYFGFLSLPKKAEKVTILIYKDKGRTRTKRKPVGRVKICVSSIQSRREVEKWYPVEKTNRRESPSIRLKAQYQSIDILPLREYALLTKYLNDEYKPLCQTLEPHISVKVKEELALSLMSVFHIQDVAEDVLAEIVVHEISSNENESLTFRGNSIATKAMETYVKMVGEKYLEDTLRSTLSDLLASDLDLEVDPVKVASNEMLHDHRQNLKNVVNIIWKRIANSHSIFPVRLQRCFHKIRQYLVQVGKADMADKLVSSCLFLRYLCPAILGPNLFRLTDEFPSERSNRNLTLIAKTLQTLANFARYEGKENSMEFMNTFLDEESLNMKQFLGTVSAAPPEDWLHGLGEATERGELGRHLASLHTVLVDSVCKVPVGESDNLAGLQTILNDISNNLHHPTSATLESIAEPTPFKIKRMSVEEKSPPSSGGSGGGLSNWIGLSWTLGRGEKRGHKVPHSVPIPQHELRARGGGKATTGSSSLRFILFTSADALS